MKCKYILMFVLLTYNLIMPQDNANNFELGTAIYRELDTDPLGIGFQQFANHWHTGVFNYFEYTSGYPTDFMVFSEAQGVGEETANKIFYYRMKKK